jgi:hypothetical protein
MASARTVAPAVASVLAAAMAATLTACPPLTELTKGGHDKPDGSDDSPGEADVALPSAWCGAQSSPHLICSDFDEGSVAGQVWEKFVQLTGRGILDEMAFTSPPASLRIDIDPITLDGGADGGAGGAALVQSVLAAPTAAHFAFDMKVNSCTPGNLPDPTMTFASLALGSSYFVAFTKEQDGMISLAEKHSANGVDMLNWHPLDPQPPVDKWFRVVFDIQLAPGSARSQPNASVTIDGHVSVSENLTAGWITQSGSVNINVGGVFTLGCTQCTLNFDDVTVDLVQ